MSTLVHEYKAHVAYLSFKKPGAICLMLQVEGRSDLEQIEISKGQLQGILIDGADRVLREWKDAPEQP